jgi:hypothetical protein
MSQVETYVDGNAIIGALSLALGADTGKAELVCAACRQNHPLAESHVYLRCPGIVIRCPNCTNTEMVLVEIAHRFQLTFTGIERINFKSGRL